MSRIRRTVSALSLTGTLAAAGLVGVNGQEPQSAVPSIPSLLDPGQGLAIRSRSAEDGLVTFATRNGDGLLLPGAAGTAAETRALAFADLYGEPFGLTNRADVRPMGRSRPDALGQEHVRLQQVRDGVPVTAGELIVHLRGNRVVAANGRTLKDVAVLLTPSIGPAGALEQAQTLIAKYRGDLAGDARFSSPRLEVFNRGMIDEGYISHAARLVHRGDAARSCVSTSGWTRTPAAILLTFSQLAEAKIAPSTIRPSARRFRYAGPFGGRRAYRHCRRQPGLRLSRGRPTITFPSTTTATASTTPEASWRSSVRYRHPSAPGTPYQNAFWNGTQMVYGEGFASADDVVAHELSHAVTERSANLLYYNQSGALNESFSDIFGETIDLTNGVGNDGPAVRWQLAEDLSIGAIRHMMTPTLFGDPGKLSDTPSSCAASDAWDIGFGRQRRRAQQQRDAEPRDTRLMVDGGSTTAAPSLVSGLPRRRRFSIGR